MAHYDFVQDFQDGRQAEEEVLGKLKAYFRLAPEDIELCDNKDFDLRLRTNGLTFEVKNDLKAYQTGNVAIEYECRGKASGLATTKADFWVYKFSGAFWLASTKQLRTKLFSEKSYWKEVTGGDPGSFTKMFLVKVTDFQSWCVRI
jgi:hypothetical protein